MVSISLGLTLFISIKILSTSTNGALLPPKFCKPLIFIFMEAPGSPPAFETEIFKLGTNPFKACWVFAIGRDSICFEVTVETAPVKLTFFTVP